MSDTLAIIVAIFGLIGLGYGAARSKLLAASVGTGLTEFVFKVAIPLLLFGTLARAEFHGLSPWRIWAAYFVPFAVTWAAGHILIRRVFGRDARAGTVAGGAAAYANSVLIGIPLMQAAFGEAGTIYLIVIVSIHLPIMMLLSIVAHEFATRSDLGDTVAAEPRREALRRLLVTLGTHPILLAIAAGLIWRMVGFQVPAVVELIIDPIGRAAGPLALVTAGMALNEFGVARQIRPAFALAGLKLLLMPALVYAAATLIGLPPLGVAVVTLTAACPTGVNAFLIAQRLGTGEALASNAMLITTAAGVLTVTLWLTVLNAGLR